jgi:hypothetical protein
MARYTEACVIALSTGTNWFQGSQNVADDEHSSKTPSKCHYLNSIQWKLTREPFTLHTTSSATDPVQQVHPDRYGPLETAIGEL